MRMDKIDANIAKVKEKIAEYQAKLRELEAQRTEQENLEILQAVRQVAVTPEEIRQVLAQIRMGKPVESQTSPAMEKEDMQHE